MKRSKEGSSLLINEEPLQVLPSLAVVVGLNEAIILQQLHYWLRRKTHSRDGHEWIYNKYDDWHRQFPFWSVSTIRRAIVELERRKIVISANFNNSNIDKTKWYRINYQKLEELFDPSTCQIGTSMSQDDMSTCQIGTSTCQIDKLDESNWHVGNNERARVGDLGTETTYREEDNLLLGREDSAVVEFSTPAAPPVAVEELASPVKLKKHPKAQPTPWPAEDRAFADWLTTQQILTLIAPPVDCDWWCDMSYVINGIPATDWLEREYAKIQMWLREKPQKKPTPRGTSRFVRTWLEKAYNHDRRERVPSPQTKEVHIHYDTNGRRR